MSRPKLIVYLAAGVALSGWLYLFQFGGYDQFKKLIPRPSIEVASTARSGVTTWFTGEGLRFTLLNTRTDKVFWVFDETKVIKGNVEIEHRFEFADEQPSGLSSDHRVDAFFKAGDGYRCTSTRVRVQNVQVLPIYLEPVS